MINIPRAPKDKVYSMQKQMGNRIRKMQIRRRNTEEMLEIKSSVTVKKKKPYNYAYYFQIKEKHFVYKQNKDKNCIQFYSETIQNKERVE